MAKVVLPFGRPRIGRSLLYSDRAAELNDPRHAGIVVPSFRRPALSSMFNPIRTVRILFVLLVLAAPLFATARSGDTTRTNLPDLLVGRWEGSLGEANYSEEWAKVSDGTYEGVALMMTGDSVMSEERMRLTYFAGQWIFIASTGDTRITSFVRMALLDGTWIFENREHDFPQHIGYKVEGSTLRAYIARADDQTDRMDFVLKKVK